MRILHAADLHIDSPMRGLARYEGAPVDAMRQATRRALSNMVDYCLGESVSLLLLAGDLFDGDWRDYSTGLFFASEMSRLREGQVQVVFTRGNHDAKSEISKHLRLPENVHELSTDAPQTIRLEELGVAVHGQGFARRAVRENLARKYPEREEGVLNVGLLHTSVTGRPGHDDYAPCTLENLLAKEYDYWALGHVHAREVLHADPWVVFSGNLQGRHVRETGKKGATRIDVEHGSIQSVQHIALDAARWERLTVPVDDLGDMDDLIDRLRSPLQTLAEANPMPLAVRVVFEGRSAIYQAFVDEAERWTATLRSTATDLGDLWIEKIQLNLKAPKECTVPQEDSDAAGYVLAGLEQLDPESEAQQQHLDTLEERLKNVAEAVKNPVLGDGDNRLARHRELLADAAALLRARLHKQSGDA